MLKCFDRGATTLSITIFSIMTISLRSLFATLSITDTQHNSITDTQHNGYIVPSVVTLSVVMPSVTFFIVMLSVIMPSVVVLTVVTPWLAISSAFSEQSLALSIEIGLERAPFVVFVYFFPHLNMQKTCWLWAPTTLKTHQKVWFFHI